MRTWQNDGCVVTQDDDGTLRAGITPKGLRALKRQERAGYWQKNTVTRILYVAVFVCAFGLGTLFGLVLQ